MTFLRCLILLQFATTLTLGQHADQSKPLSVPTEPKALVRSLYQEVIARHPIGIPWGANKEVFAPYLSNALLHRIQLAVACGKDWDRQHPDPNLKPELAWLEIGLFSGDVERASPRAFHIEKTQAAKDGSSRVYVRLTWGSSVNPWMWHVAPILIREEGHFVVDDVIYLKDDHEDESRLSEWLSAGCDGPRWVGYGGKRNDPKE